MKIETGIDYLNKVKAIEVWVKAEKKDAELQNIVAEQKVRTQRIIGKMLKEAELNKGTKGQLKGKDSGGHLMEPPENNKPKLSDYGITKNESSTFQKISTIPEREPEVRSYNMSQIKEKDTKPEITIRKITS